MVSPKDRTWGLRRADTYELKPKNKDRAERRDDNFRLPENIMASPEYVQYKRAVVEYSAHKRDLQSDSEVPFRGDGDPRMDTWSIAKHSPEIK